MNDSRLRPCRKAAAVAALVLVFPSLPVPAFAESGPSADSIEAEDLFGIVARQKVTTATLSPIPVSKTPGTVSVITKKQIREMGATTLDEMLTHLPGVDVRENGMGNVIDVRTFGSDTFGSSVEILIDGAPYNGPETGGVASVPSFDSFPVPIEMVQQVEVIREPVSTLYGNNALHGVINIITKNGSDFNGSGEASARAGSRSLQRYGAVYGGKNGDLDFVFAGNYLRQDGPIQLVKGSTLQDGNGAAKLRYRDLTLAWFSKISADSPYAYDFASPYRTSVDHQVLQLGTLAYGKDLSDGVSVHAQSSFLGRSGSNCQVCHNSQYFRAANPADHTQSFYRLTEDLRTTLKSGDRNEAVLGLSYVRDHDDMPSGSLQPRFGANTFSAYAQDKLELAPGKLSLTLGARQDYSDWSTIGGLTSPRALLVYTPNEDTTLRAGVTRAYQLPSYEDRYRMFKFLSRPSQDPTGQCGFASAVKGYPICQPNFPVGGDFFFSGNPGLKPARSDTANLGVDRWVTHKLLLKVNGYFSNVVNSFEEEHMTAAEFKAFTNGSLPNGQATYPIQPLPPYLPQTLASQVAWDEFVNSSADIYINNPSHARELGADVEADYEPLPSLKIQASYTYKNVYYDATSAQGTINGLTLADPLPKIPGNAPHHLAELSVTGYPGPRVMLNADLRYRGAYFARAATQQVKLPPGPPSGQHCPPGSFPSCLDGSTAFNGAVPAAGTLFLNLTASYTFPGGLNLSLNGRNLFNQDTQEWIQILDERLVTGRDIFIEARYPFGGPGP